MVPLISPRSLSKNTSKPVAADSRISPPADASYCRYLGSLVTKLHREVALPKLIADCGKAIVENAANQTGWNYMMISIAANWALNGMSNTITQLAFIGLQLSVIPLFVTIARLLVVLTPKHYVAVQDPFVHPGKLSTIEHVDKMMAKVPNKQDADTWLGEIHLTRDHSVLRNWVRFHDGASHGGFDWSLDRKGSYVPATVFWSLCILYLWTSQIAKQNILFVAFFVEHIGTASHVHVDTFVVGLWHHVNSHGEIDSVGFCTVLHKVLHDTLQVALISALILYLFGIQLSGPALGLVVFVGPIAAMVGYTNHYFQHGRSKQRLPKLIRKYLFKGFLWKCKIFVDDLFHKKHHFDSPEDNFAITVGFMDKLVHKLKHGQTLYMHNPKLNQAMFTLYFISMWCFQGLCARATSKLLV